MNRHTIIKNTDRYPGIDPKMPDLIGCIGTREQAEELARRLSNWNAGCDHSFYVDEGDDDELG